MCAQQGQLRESGSSWVALQRGCLQAGGHPRCGGVIKRRHAASLGEAKPLGVGLGRQHIPVFKEKTLRSEGRSRTLKVDSCVSVEWPWAHHGFSVLTGPLKFPLTVFVEERTWCVCVLVYESACICTDHQRQQTPTGK